MRKILLLISVVLSAFSANMVAQNGVVFCDENGQVITGSEITSNVAEYDAFDCVMIQSGVYVKNQATSACNIKASLNIESLSGGCLQCCFPNECRMLTQVGTTELGTCEIGASVQRSLLTELMVDDETQPAECVATITITDNAGNNGKSLKINFVFDPLTLSINQTTNASVLSSLSPQYNIAGQKVGKEYKGIVIRNGRKYLNK